MSLSYRDRAFCPKSDRNNPKCVKCDRFFDKAEYEYLCAKKGFKMPVCWFLEPPCGDTDKENFVVNLNKESDNK